MIEELVPVRCQIHYLTLTFLLYLLHACLIYFELPLLGPRHAGVSLLFNEMSLFTFCRLISRHDPQEVAPINDSDTPMKNNP